jgi:hypothetical protein
VEWTAVNVLVAIRHLGVNGEKERRRGKAKRSKRRRRRIGKRRTNPHIE